MKNKKKKRDTKKINTQYVFSENNQVSIKIDKNIDKWYPINFQWIPIIELQKNSNE